MTLLKTLRLCFVPGKLPLLKDKIMNKNDQVNKLQFS